MAIFDYAILITPIKIVSTEPMLSFHTIIQ